MSEEQTPESAEEETSMSSRIEGAVEDLKEKVDGGLAVVGKVDETVDQLAPVLEKMSPAVETALNLALPGAGTALGVLAKMGKAGVKGLLNLTAADAWQATLGERGTQWDHLVHEVNEKLGIVVTTSALKVHGGFLYRVLTCKKDGTAPRVTLQYVKMGGHYISPHLTPSKEEKSK
jgi:hypothetical protein